MVSGLVDATIILVFEHSHRINICQDLNEPLVGFVEFFTLLRHKIKLLGLFLRFAVDFLEVQVHILHRFESLFQGLRLRGHLGLLLLVSCFQILILLFQSTELLLDDCKLFDALSLGRCQVFELSISHLEVRYNWKMILDALLEILQVLLELEDLHLLVGCLLAEALVVDVQGVHLEVGFALLRRRSWSDRCCLIRRLVLGLLGGELHVLLLL